MLNTRLLVKTVLRPLFTPQARFASTQNLSTPVLVTPTRVHVGLLVSGNAGQRLHNTDNILCDLPSTDSQASAYSRCQGAVHIVAFPFRTHISSWSRTAGQGGDTDSSEIGSDSKRRPEIAPAVNTG